MKERTTNKKIWIALFTIAVVLMLTAGVTLSQYKTAQMITQNTSSATKIEYPCPCHQKNSQQRGIEYDEPPETNYTPCSIITDPVTGQNYTLADIYYAARPHMMPYTGILGCDGEGQGQAQQQQAQTDVIITGGGLGFSVPAQPKQPNSIPQDVESGFNETVVLQRIAALDIWFASPCGTQSPNFGDYGLIPGTWHLGPAMMVCMFVGLRVVGASFTAASMAALGAFAQFCNFAIAMAIWWEIGLSYGTEIYQTYWTCVTWLIG